MMDNSSAILQVKDAVVAFGGHVAVDHVSFSIRRGEFLSLLGPSGCGKTTLLRAIAGYVPLRGGDIFLSGRRMTEATPQQRRIGMVFQNYALFPHLSVAENIAFGLQVQGRPREDIRRRVRDMLEIVRLPDFEDRRPTQLSGGQQQRVALARALAFEPQLLLLDEPLSALDLRLRESMQLEIRRIQKETGITTVFVTHDQGEALAMSDIIAVMNRGHIEQMADPQTLYRDPQTAFVADFVGRSNLVDAEIVGEAELTARRGPVALAVTLGPDCRKGPCRIAIRPELIRLSRGGNGLAGRIAAVTFQGSHSLLSVVCDDGLTLTVHTNDAWYAGETASITWRPDDARLLTFDEPA